MNDGDKIAALYEVYANIQKNTKGVKSRADTVENFRGKKGYNDTGIALSLTTIKKQHNNRAGYYYPYHLQRINEKRKADAMSRHNITDENDPLNIKINKISTQPAVSTNRRSTSWHLPMDNIPRKKNYNYYEIDTPKQVQQEVIYIIPTEAKKVEDIYKPTGKFPKLDEAIKTAKKKLNQ